MPKVLEVESKKFQRARNRLLAAGEGKWVLMRGDNVIGVWPTFTF